MMSIRELNVLKSIRHLRHCFRVLLNRIFRKRLNIDNHNLKKMQDPKAIKQCKKTLDSLYVLKEKAKKKPAPKPTSYSYDPYCSDGGPGGTICCESESDFRKLVGRARNYERAGYDRYTAMSAAVDDFSDVCWMD